MMTLRFVLMGCVVVTLAACGGSGDEELQTWMTEQRNMARPKITPLEEPKKFIPQPYTQRGIIEPFDPMKLTRALKRDSTQTAANATLISPELTRRKEPLEAYPLDIMAMVGSLQKAGQPVALVRVDKLLYQVKVGNYLGQNYGRVMKVTETEVVLREIVQDATGDWIERPATLQLQEKSK